MKKKVSAIFFLLLVVSTIILIFCIFERKNPYESQQEDLANKIGVRIEDYPYTSVFPLGYFNTTLLPGMTLDETHQLIQGYEKVFRCPTSSYTTNYYKEIYYYFSDDDDKALRFEIFYDDQGRFTNIQTEDDDSRTIRRENCEIGPIR